MPQSVARFGTWDSPLTPELVSGASVVLGEPAVDGECLYWLEQRPAERGRRALTCSRGGAAPRDVLPEDADVGTRVHEYGGGAYAVRSGIVVYSERSDGSVRLVRDGAPPRTIAAVAGCRYAGFAIDVARERVFAVREDHREREPTAPENALVVLPFGADLDPAANAGRVVAGGSDFTLAPALDAAGTRAAWIAWNHPDMPWDATRLYVADVGANGDFGAVRCVAGAQGGESIVAACWSPDGRLLFVSDRTNWWNVYGLDGDRTDALAPVAAEFAEPPWVMGNPWLAPLDAERVLCAFARDGIVHAGLIDGGTVFALPYGQVASAPLPFGAGTAFLAASPERPAAVCYVPRVDSDDVRVIRSSVSVPLDPADVSLGEALAIPTGDGETTHVFFYPPRNARFTGPPGELPPLIVMSHGGPTAMHTNALNLGVQWWTTRGFAVAHVNYRGSSGFGRAYRERLAGTWGELDVADCIAAARWLVENGRCDPARIAIRGGSASGMTALLAVATSNVFAAATSLYGVMELETLAGDTHKFEARYTDRLVGPLPEAREIYARRSPLTHVASIRVPVLLFQGLEDRVVPPAQATAMRDALAARGVPVIYEAFEGEGHGFRKAETLRRVFERELAFYRDVFGLTA